MDGTKNTQAGPPVPRQRGRDVPVPPPRSRGRWWSALWRYYTDLAVCSDPRLGGAWIDGYPHGISIYERGWPRMLPPD